eukprot:Sspe_Gene.89664::Locus_61384_Transcript_1_1_Confidence_1.000_Length_1031::g.89664::m.89664
MVRWERPRQTKVPKQTEGGAMVVLHGLPLLIGGYQEQDIGDEVEDEEEGEEEEEELLVLHLLRAEVWERHVAAGVPHLEGLSAVREGTDSALLYGGIDASYDLRSETYRLSLKEGSPCVEVVGTAGETPPPRTRHCAVLVQDAMYVYGGYDDVALGDLYALEGGRWKHVHTPVSPPHRFSSSAAAGERSFYIFGGAAFEGGEQVSLSDCWEFQVGGGVWREIEVAPSPSPRNGHILACEGHLLVVFGGGPGAGSGGGLDGSYDNRIMIIDPARGEVRYVVCDGPPEGRYMPSAAVHDRVLHFHGGNRRNPGPSDLYTISLRDVVAV